MRREFFGFVLLALGPARGFAFPDLIRHGYVNCTACHVSPTGGGLLNPYGRALSRELLSAWGSERETEPLHGALPKNSIPEWLLLGGDVRAIQVHKETPERRQGYGFLMQANIDGALKAGPLTAVMSLGQADRKTRTIAKNAPRYFLQWNPQDQMAVRAGRFVPVFGINVPYHTLPTRQGLGFAPGMERDTFESVWSGEEWNLAASVSRTLAGPMPSDSRETLFSAQVNRVIFGTSRIGASYLAGFQADSDREAVGLHGTIGMNDRWAYLTETDLQSVRPRAGRKQSGLFHFSQLIYEPAKGLHLYFLEDYQKSNLSEGKTAIHSFGPGLRFFPRPHFEFDFAFLKRKTAAVADRCDDFAWLLSHYYF